MEYSQVEKDMLTSFAENKLLFGLIERVANKILNEEQTKIIQMMTNTGALEGVSNQAVGEKLRAYAEGRRLVDAILSYLAQFDVPEKELKINPGK